MVGRDSKTFTDKKGKGITSFRGITHHQTDNPCSSIFFLYCKSRAYILPVQIPRSNFITTPTIYIVTPPFSS